MSSYIGVGSISKKISDIYIGVDGKARQVKKAYIGVDGVAKLWYQRSTPLGVLPVGSTVKIAVDGKDYDWLVVHQGLPGSMYDASCDGTWLLMKDIYTEMAFDSGIKDFRTAEIFTYLQNTFYPLIDESVRNQVKNVKIPCSYNGKNYPVISGANGLACKVFLLSDVEVNGNYRYYRNEGAKLSYFSGNSTRIAYLSTGAAKSWWLRTLFDTLAGGKRYVDAEGKTNGYKFDDVRGVRPCMILPQDALVDDTGHIIAADDPRTPLGLYSVGSTIKMDINGNKRVWRIAYKGNPNPNLYDESCNGVWLVLNTIYSTRANGSDCQYAGGTIDTYLNGTFLGRIDKDGNAAKYIKDVKIPYTKKQGDGSWEVQTKENGLPCKVFLPSIFELGGAENLSIYKDGSKLGYYDGSAATLTLNQSGTPAPWRTRTVTSDAQSEFSIDANGTITTCSPTDVIGVVPCVIMNPDALVENGIIIGE